MVSFVGNWQIYRTALWWLAIRCFPEGSGFVYEQKELFSMKLDPVGPPFSDGDF
jgi:hypothetical protein